MNKIDLETNVCDAVRWVAITQLLLREMGETTMSVFNTPEGREAFWERFAQVRLAADQVEHRTDAIKKLFYEGFG